MALAIVIHTIKIAMVVATLVAATTVAEFILVPLW
jgi:hypothetical protein